MLKFWLLNTANRGPCDTLLDHVACLEYARFMPPNWLSKDIEAWRDKAQHGDVFVLNHHLALACLDLDLPFEKYMNRGPCKMWDKPKKKRGKVLTSKT